MIYAGVVAVKSTKNAMERQPNQAQIILTFLRQAEKLKTELRHSWLSDPTRQESVAEHTWMSLLFAMAVATSMEQEIDQLKVLKMLIIHDLPEAIIGDIPVFEISERKEQKYETEKRAIREITHSLPHQLAEEICALWQEFEAKETNEALLAQAIDKMEANIQHNLADLDTWDEGDYRVQVGYKDPYFQFDRFIKDLKVAVNQQTYKKVSELGKLSNFSPEQLSLYV